MRTNFWIAYNIFFAVLSGIAGFFVLWWILMPVYIVSPVWGIVVFSALSFFIGMFLSYALFSIFNSLKFGKVFLETIGLASGFAISNFFSAFFASNYLLESVISALAVFFAMFIGVFCWVFYKRSKERPRTLICVSM